MKAPARRGSQGVKKRGTKKMQDLLYGFLKERKGARPEEQRWEDNGFGQGKQPEAWPGPGGGGGEGFRVGRWGWGGAGV